MANKNQNKNTTTVGTFKEFSAKAYKEISAVANLGDVITTLPINAHENSVAFDYFIVRSMIANILCSGYDSVEELKSDDFITTLMIAGLYIGKDDAVFSCLGSYSGTNSFREDVSNVLSNSEHAIKFYDKYLNILFDRDFTDEEATEFLNSRLRVVEYLKSKDLDPILAFPNELELLRGCTNSPIALGSIVSSSTRYCMISQFGLGLDTLNQLPAATNNKKYPLSVGFKKLLSETLKQCSVVVSSPEFVSFARDMRNAVVLSDYMSGLILLAMIKLNGYSEYDIEEIKTVFGGDVAKALKVFKVDGVKALNIPEIVLPAIKERIEITNVESNNEVPNVEECIEERCEESLDDMIKNFDSMLKTSVDKAKDVATEVERSSRSSSSSSSSSDDDEGLGFLGWAGIILGGAALCYAGAVAWNYFSSGEITFGEAVDNVNDSITSFLGFGDSIDSY